MELYIRKKESQKLYSSVHNFTKRIFNIVNVLLCNIYDVIIYVHFCTLNLGERRSKLWKCIHVICE